METCFRFGPTFGEMLDPARRAEGTGWVEELFDITWKDSQGTVRHLLLPPALTGVDAAIIVLLGDGFPTGSHKVGPAYAVAMSQQLFGGINPSEHCLVWPSTGNYGIGGSWVGARLGYSNTVVMPALMSQERYEMLGRYGAEIVRTPGSESNVKEVYERCEALSQDPRVRVLDQFSDWSNYRFHYHVTGNSILQLVTQLAGSDGGNGRVSAFVAGMGSAGILAAGDRIKQAFPGSLVVGLEPVQCPTLYCNGYGTHAIEGMGNRHVTWIHNTYNMDGLICVDERDCLEGLYLLTSRAGQEALVEEGVLPAVAGALSQHLGVSGVCNVLGAIKTARYYGMTARDTLVTVATDGIDRYHSVVKTMHERLGPLGLEKAQGLLDRIFHSPSLDYFQEGTRENRRRWHNLKYFTWVEQRGRPLEQLQAQEDSGWWLGEQAKVQEFDRSLMEIRGSL